MPKKTVNFGKKNLFLGMINNQKQRFLIRWFQNTYLQEVDGLLKLDKPDRMKALYGYLLFYLVITLFGVTAFSHYFTGISLVFVSGFVIMVTLGSIIPLIVLINNPARRDSFDRLQLIFVGLSGLLGFFFGLFIEDFTHENAINIQPNSNQPFPLFYGVLWAVSVVLFQYGIRIYNQLTKKLYSSMQSRQNELELAREIQTRFLPEIAVDENNVLVYGKSALASEVGGDYFDAIRVSNGWVLAVGDVSGHGMAAGLLMTSIRSAFRTELNYQRDVSKILNDLNVYILEHTRRKLFMTFSIVYLDFDANQAIFANAGHLPTLIKTVENKVETIKPKGVGLGISEKALFHIEKHSLSNIHQILMITDGLLEARNKEGDEFGFERLKNLFDLQKDAAQLISTIREAKHVFSDDVRLRDDETVLCCEIKNQ